VVIQVSDDKLADAGLTKIANCAATGDADDNGDASSQMGWAIAEGWAVIAENDDLADTVVADTAKGALADNSTYSQWVDEVGDPGIVNMYLAPEAGTMFLDSIDSLTSQFGGMTEMSASSGADPAAFTTVGSSDDTLPDDMRSTFEDFQGMAATIRINDGAFELELAGDPGDASTFYGSSSGTDVMSTLPDDTAAAFGVRFADGWFTKMMDQVASEESGVDIEELFSQLEVETGLSLPEDVETLMGDSAVISLGSDFDVDTFEQSTDGSGVPVGLKVHGDPSAIEEVLDKLRGQMPSDAASFMDSDSSGDMVAVAPDDDYRSALLEDGSLGDNAIYRDVVREGDQASMVLFVNFDANDWLTNLAGDDQEAQDNLAPLTGMGMSMWVDGDASHAVFRVTTD
jgi:hypothetical protein